MTLLASILIQIGANFANDVFDFEKGSDREGRLGPLRVTQAGLISPKKMKNAMWIIFCIAIFAGFYLSLKGGLPIVIIGLASIISGILYTGGPYPLGYHGWGDFFVFIFFGLIAVPGTYYLQTGNITLNSIYLGIVMGMLSNAILVVNNLRDMDLDKISGKHTLAVRFGSFFSKIQYSLLVLLPIFLPLYFWINNIANSSILLTCFSFPIACNLSANIFLKKGSDLNQILTKTARFLFIYTLLFSVGLII